MSFEAAHKIADALLYEGYVLYPYRASSGKNQVRWQFGVVAPRAYSEATGTDPWFMQSECLLESSDPSKVHIDLQVRCLQVQERRIARPARFGDFEDVERLEVDGRPLIGFEEASEQRIDLSLASLVALAERSLIAPIEIEGGRIEQEVFASSGALAAKIIRERRPIRGTIQVSARAVNGLWKLRVRIENHTACEERDRAPAMRSAMVGTHALFAIQGGKFLSLTDPPPEAAAIAASCENVRTWPILVGVKGQEDQLLSSPIILNDHPEIAPESRGNFYDATEIDEILTLRVMTLTEEEKREARATDPRAAEIVERSDTIPEEYFERLHGALRSVEAVEPTSSPDAREPVDPQWDPFALDDGREVGGSEVTIRGVKVAKGSNVRLHPCRKADAMDMFLDGEVARVEGVYRDVDDVTYVAVTVAADPAQDLQAWYGRYFYFYPEEVEPLGDDPKTNEKE